MVTEKPVPLWLQYYISLLWALDVLGPGELTFSAEHIFGDRTVRSSLQETAHKLNKISTDVLLDARRLGMAVAITQICTADKREKARHEKQTAHPAPPASPCTAAGTGTRQLSEVFKQGNTSAHNFQKDKAQLISTSPSCTHCAVVRHRRITMIYRIFLWSPATFWLGSQRSLHALQRQRLQRSVAAFPPLPIRPRIPPPKRHPTPRCE